MKRNLFTIMLAFLVVFGVNAQKSSLSLSDSRDVNQKVYVNTGGDSHASTFFQKGVTFSDDFEGGDLSNFTVINGGDANGFVWASAGGNLAPACVIIDYSSTAHDDWLITPAYTAEVGSYLKFQTKNQSTTYVEEFDVMLSTTGTNAADFTVTLEAAVAPGTAYEEKSYDLSAYAGQTIYIGLHITTTDEWTLYLDEFEFGVPDAYDASFTVKNAPYIINPLSQMANGTFGGNVVNVGSSDVTNAILSAVVNDGTSDVFTGVSDAVATLAAGANQDVVTNTSFTPAGLGDYTVNYTLSIDEADGNLTNNVASVAFNVNDSVMASDDGMADQGSMGIGDGTDGAVGQLFTLNADDKLTSVSFYLGASGVTLNGDETMNVIVYDFDGTVPTTLLYESPTYTSGTTEGWVTVELGTHLDLVAGTYFFGLHELDKNIKIARETDNYVPYTSYLYYTGQPWISTDDFNSGLNGTYLIRPNFGPLGADATLSDLTVDATTVTGFDPATYTYDVELPYGTTVVPTVVGTPTDANATAVTTDAAALPGSSTVLVTAEDGTTQLTYTVNFTLGTATQVANIAALRAGATDGTVYELTGEAILTYQQSYRNNKFIQDATAAILIDDNSGKITTTYALGDGITGITGTLSEYNNMLQFVPVDDPGVATSNGNVIVPEVITLAQLTANFEDYEAELVEISDITFVDADGTAVFANGTIYSITDASSKATGKFRTNFYDVDYIGTVIPNNVNLTGICWHKGADETIAARDAADLDIIIGINDIASKGISVYPNPSNGTFTVNVENDFNLEVLDITGKVINTQVLNGTNIVNINNAGVYFLRFSNKEGSVTQKVIVQ